VPQGHGIDDEPLHPRRRAAGAGDPPDRAATHSIEHDHAPQREDSEAEAARFSVFDEPWVDRSRYLHLRCLRDWPCDRCGYNRRGLTYGDACPECGDAPEVLAPGVLPGYGQWLLSRMATTRPATQWAAFAVAALSGGPFAVLGALLMGGGALSLVLFGPTAEEVLKVAIIWMILEHRPYWFRSATQIRLAGYASGLAFSVIENLIYLNLYIPDPGPGITLWRWTVCTALHVGCTAIAVEGAARAWRRTVTQLVEPSVDRVARWVTAAIVVHAAYNSLALLFETVAWRYSV